MSILTWSIINNEMDFLPEIVPFHLQFVDAMYFLDTGSTDGSLEFLQEFAVKDKRIIVEKYHQSFVPDHSVEWREMQNPFPEIEVRNFAISKAELLGYEWLIQLDGDEVFLPKVKTIIEKTSKSIVSHSTINPVEDLNKHPIEIRNGIKLHDPHARIWRPNLKIRYAQNPAMKKQYHCIPVQNGKHLYHSKDNEFVADIFHFHLHWMYGDKLEKFNEKLGIKNRPEIIKKQVVNQYGALLSKIFWDRRKEWTINE